MKASGDGDHLNSHQPVTVDLKYGTAPPNKHKSAILTAVVSVAYLALVRAPLPYVSAPLPVAWTPMSMKRCQNVHEPFCAMQIVACFASIYRTATPLPATCPSGQFSEGRAMATVMDLADGFPERNVST